MFDTQPNQSHELALTVLEKAIQENTVANSHKERLISLVVKAIRNELPGSLMTKEKSEEFKPTEEQRNSFLADQEIQCVGIGIDFTMVKDALEEHPRSYNKLIGLREQGKAPVVSKVRDGYIVFHIHNAPMSAENNYSHKVIDSIYIAISPPPAPSR